MRPSLAIRDNFRLNGNAFNRETFGHQHRFEERGFSSSNNLSLHGKLSRPCFCIIATFSVLWFCVCLIRFKPNIDVSAVCFLWRVV